MRLILGCAIGCALGLTVTGQPAPQSHGCVPALSEQKKAEFVKYVMKRYSISSLVNVKIANVREVADTCYKELRFEGSSSVNTWRLTLYLSPDQRFLTDELFDTTVDPEEDERRKAQTLMADLAQNRGASRGSESAPVTIVVFSDFECPFCRRFADILKVVIQDEKDQVRVIFHHFPLSMHAWARSAAEGAACAQLQNPDAFWSVHDYLFAHQDELTPENITTNLNAFAKSVKRLNGSAFEDCQQNQMSLGLVLKDINMASENNVNATPTLFINGHRVQGVKDAAQLKQLIAEARREALAKRASVDSNDR